jgi:hypothetical protein
MKEHPILFNNSMVRALLDGSKTQARRVVRQACSAAPAPQSVIDGAAMYAAGMVAHCPYGRAGDHIWVRETFFAYGRWETRFSTKKARDEWHFVDMTVESDRVYQLASDDPDLPMTKGRGGALPGWYKRPAIFMPRVASRILLENLSVRVERLQNIREADALAEGVRQDKAGGFFMDGADGRYASPVNSSAVEAFKSLWDSNGGNWAANPWCWAITFNRVAP